jgi:hypothetical protein
MAYSPAHTNHPSNNLDAHFGSWMLDAGFSIIGLHRLDSTTAAGDCLVTITLRALDKPFPDTCVGRLHDFDRQLTNCTEHDVLPIVLLYIDVYKVPLAEAHSNILY